MITLALSISDICSLRPAPCQSAVVSEGPKRSISRTQLVTTLVGATISARSASAVFSCLRASKSAMVWMVLPRPMSSASTPPDAISSRNCSQDRPCSW